MLKSFLDLEIIELAMKSRIFREWQANLDPRFKVKSIVFQSVDTRGTGPIDKREVLFIKLVAEVEDGEGNRIPGVVFIRGGAVAILVVLHCEGEEYTVLVNQPRFASGAFEFPEIPAGIIDENGSFASNAARELEEEIGIKIRENELLDMTEVMYGRKWRGIYPSPGALAEFIRIFLYQKYISRENLESLQGKRTGLAAEGEQIKLKVIPLKSLEYETPDAKSIVAYALYRCLADKLGI